MADFQYDPEQPRPEPDRETLVKAHALMLRDETKMQRYLRQQWETAMAATKVAYDAWCRIYPLEVADHLPDDELHTARTIHIDLADVVQALDHLGAHFQGEVMHEAQAMRLNITDLTHMEHGHTPVVSHFGRAE